MKLSEGLQDFYKKSADEHNLSILRNTIAGLEIRLKKSVSELYDYKRKLDLKDDEIKILLEKTEQFKKKLQSSKRKVPKIKLIKNIFEDLEMLRK